MVSTSVVELKEKILSLGVTYPDACTIAINRLAQSPTGMDLMIVSFSIFGLEYSRQMFDCLSLAQWQTIEVSNPGAALSRSGAESSTEALARFYQFLVSEALDWSVKTVPPSQGLQQGLAQNSGQFSYDDNTEWLRDLSRTQLLGLFSGLDPTEIAIVFAGLETFEVSRILDALPKPARRVLILQMERIKRLPEQTVHSRGSKLRETLKVKTDKIRLLSSQKLQENSLQSLKKPLPTPPKFVSKAPLKGAGPVIEIAVKGDFALEEAMKVLTSSAGIQVEDEILAFLKREAPEIQSGLADQGYLELRNLRLLQVKRVLEDTRETTK